MKRSLWIRLVAALAAGWLAFTATSALAAKDDDDDDDKESGGGWEQLLKGSDTSKWRGYKKPEFPAKGWVAEKGVLHHLPKSGAGDIITKETYTDFELRFDWKVAPGANSGVMYRVAEVEGPAYMTGPEYQVLDDATHGDGKNPKTSAAALYALIAANAEKALKPVGEWNKARIVVRGNHVEHWLNKKKVVDYTLNSPDTTDMIAKSKFKDWPRFAREASGHICLQDHNDEVWFRKLKIRRFEAKK
jgi:hypothetical protein